MKIDLTRYALWYLAGLVGVVLLSAILKAAAGFALPAGVPSIIPPILAAMMEGQRIARDQRAPLSANDLLRSAALMTAVVAAINLVILGLFLALPATAQMLAQVPLWILVGLFVALLVVAGLLNWFFLRQSIGNELKRQARDKG